LLDVNEWHYLIKECFCLFYKYFELMIVCMWWGKKQDYTLFSALALCYQSATAIKLIVASGMPLKCR